ncbi:formate dehydrogenase subunit gamma [Chloroflexota bacterium]
MRQRVEKYRKRTRVLHWIHTTAFILLFLTGLIIFVPGLSALATGGWTRIVHRVAASIFVIIPLVYLVLDWKGAWRGIGRAFSWGSQDMGWLKAAPGYYFLNDESKMPAQGEMNSGQKLWWLIAILSGLLFVISGAVMWFARDAAPPGLLQWMVLIHDISFITSGVMLLVHIYLAICHPLMTEAWGSMISGTISAEYAKSHHGKWYNEIAGKKES